MVSNEGQDSSPSYSTPAWWKEATVYQIYPASFQSTGSGSEPGWGDVRGITSRLDYLKDLGVDVVWVSPIYKSPQVDMGYDISDYMDIDPKYGTLADVDELIKGLKNRGMHLMMDLVVNHTSDQHAWFLDARSSKNSSKRDWYIWQPPRYVDGKRHPPNNWSSILGNANSAWTWDDTTQEYYLALFTPEQPDLNWRNQAVREAVHEIQRFWLERGASGFRMDVINLISKVEGFPDADIKDPKMPYQPGHVHYANGPELHNYLHEMNTKVLSKYDTITVGEMPFIHDEEEILRGVKSDRKELNMIFIFDLVNVDNGHERMDLRSFKPPEMRNIINKWQSVMQDNNGWNSVFVENHDNPRSVTRYTDDSDQYRHLGAKLLALLLTTLGGTLYVYQGQELGMRNFPKDWAPEEYKDIESINYWKKINALFSEDENALSMARNGMQRKARDHSRTPVQWSADSNTGFCAPGTKPWMRINDDYKTVNATAQQSDVNSVHSFWRQALQMRKKNKHQFVYGQFELVDDQHPTMIAYKRRAVDSSCSIVALNLSGQETEWSIPENLHVTEWYMGNYGKESMSNATSGKLKLRPWEGLVGTCASK